eukprot:1157902-Pelagomonas_calceolata.AAC.12
MQQADTRGHQRGKATQDSTRERIWGLSSRVNRDACVLAQSGEWGLEDMQSTWTLRAERVTSIDLDQCQGSCQWRCRWWHRFLACLLSCFDGMAFCHLQGPPIMQGHCSLVSKLGLHP